MTCRRHARLRLVTIATRGQTTSKTSPSSRASVAAEVRRSRTTCLNSTPDTDFRLEFFRNESCNARLAGIPQFYGEGQTLVGVQQVTTDAGGNWSGPVALSGGTAPTELITATATRFSEPGVSLAGSTSEFSECRADLSITKTDEPDPVAVGAPLTYTIDVVNDGPAPATEVRVTDTLPSGVTVTSITPSQGDCTRIGSAVTCLLGLIGRNGAARVAIVLNPGSTVRPITNTARVSSELRDPDESDNSASATTQVVTGATIVVEKRTVPAGDAQRFTFTGMAAGVIGDAQTIQVSALSPGAYTSTESVVSGWDLTRIACDDSDSSGSTQAATATFRVAAGETVTCTFTNTKRGLARVVKTVRGTPPSGSQSFTFQLRQGASTTSAGTTLESADASGR